MPVRYVTHPNGAIEIMGVLTPREELEWLTKYNKVSRFPSANHRSALKSLDSSPPKPKPEE
jgi:hypothetical protein